MVDKLYHRANQHSSFRPIVHLVVEIQCFVCTRTTPPIIEKLLSEGVAMAFLHTTREPEISKWPWVGPFKMGTKIKQGSNLPQTQAHFRGEGKESLVHTVCACTKFTE